MEVNEIDKIIKGEVNDGRTDKKVWKFKGNNI
jgi:hypothetical protein